MKISSSHRMKTFVVLQLCTPSNFPHIVLTEVSVVANLRTPSQLLTNQRQVS